MIRGYLDRMMRSRPREITLYFRKVDGLPGNDGMISFETEEVLNDQDRAAVQEFMRGRTFVDGQIVKVPR